MFNISECIALVRDADSIISSSILTDEQRGQLISELLASIPPAFNRPYIATVTSALEALYAIYRPTETGPSEGQQDTTSVDTGAGSPAAEAPQGPTAGLQEQAQDAGSLDSASNDGGASTEAAAPAEKPKSGKARK